LNGDASAEDQLAAFWTVNAELEGQSYHLLGLGDPTAAVALVQQAADAAAVQLRTDQPPPSGP
jgi:hypothetical protein